MSNPSEILGAVYRKDVGVLRELNSDDVNKRDQDGRTALMHAVLAEDADPSIVKLLIGRGADVNAADHGEKWTALHFAARDQREDIVLTLLDAGSKVDPLDVFGNTPLWRSVMNVTSDLGAINALVKHKADPFKKNHHGRAPIDIARDTGRADIVSIFEEKQ